MSKLFHCLYISTIIFLVIFSFLEYRQAVVNNFIYKLRDHCYNRLEEINKSAIEDMSKLENKNSILLKDNEELRKLIKEYVVKNKEVLDQNKKLFENNEDLRRLLKECDKIICSYSGGTPISDPR